MRSLRGGYENKDRSPRLEQDLDALERRNAGFAHAASHAACQ